MMGLALGGPGPTSCLHLAHKKVDPLIWGPVLLRVLHRNPPLRDLLFGSSRGSGFLVL